MVRPGTARSSGRRASCPPEQAAGRGSEVGVGTDVYSLGAMIYALYAGHPPHQTPDRARDRVQLLTAVVREPALPLRDATEGAPPAVSAIAEKALNPLVEARYASMRELTDDLRAYLEGRPVQAFDGGVMAAVRAWVGRNRALTTAIAIAVLTAAAAASWTLRQNSVAIREARLALEFHEWRDLVSEKSQLWPAIPATVPRMQSWLDRALRLEPNLETHVERFRSVDEKTPRTADGVPAFLTFEEEFEWGNRKQLAENLGTFLHGEGGGRGPRATAHGVRVGARVPVHFR